MPRSLPDLENKILEFLRQRGEASTEEVAAGVGCNRATASKWLHILFERGLVEYRVVGPVKLWRLKESVSPEKVKKELENARTIQISIKTDRGPLLSFTIMADENNPPSEDDLRRVEELLEMLRELKAKLKTSKTGREATGH